MCIACRRFVFQEGTILLTKERSSVSLLLLETLVYITVIKSHEVSLQATNNQYFIKILSTLLLNK